MAERWDPTAVAQMEEIWRANGKTLDDAAKDRWAGAGGYLYKQGEYTGDGTYLAPYESGGQINDYWKMRMGHDANGTEFDPGGAMRAKMRGMATQPGGVMALQSLMTQTPTMAPTTETPTPEMSVGGGYTPTPPSDARTTPGARTAESPYGEYGAPTYTGSAGGDLGMRSGVSDGVRQALSALNTPSSPIAQGTRVPPSPDEERQTMRGLMQGRR